MANAIERYFDEVSRRLPQNQEKEVELQFPDQEADEGFDPFPLGGADDEIRPVSDKWEIENARRLLIDGRAVERINEEDRRLLDGAVREVGLDVYAFYKSRRYLAMPPYPGKWGIFYLAHGVSRIAEIISEVYPGYGDSYHLAYSFLRAHERYHYKFDVYALGVEAILGKSRYHPMKMALKNHRARDLEEALANREAWIWAKSRKIGLEEFAYDFMKLQPGSYNRFDEDKRSLNGELAANFIELDFSASAFRPDQQLWVATIPTEFARRSLCQEYFVYPSALSNWIRPAWKLPEVKQVIEAQSVLKLLASKYSSMREQWEETKRKLLANPALPGLDFKRWDKAKRQWSVRIDRNFRAHLHQKNPSSGIWEVDEIGTHKAMGHG